MNVRDGVVVRPEAVRVRRATDGERGDAVVEEAVRVGATVRLVLRRDDGESLVAVTTALDHPEPGDRVHVEIDPAGVVDVA